MLVTAQYLEIKSVEAVIFGCLLSFTDNPKNDVAALKVPAVKFTVAGEYSIVPVLSPIGNVKEPVVVYTFLNVPPKALSAIK